MAIENQKVQESKTTCPKGIFTEEEFMKIVKVVGSGDEEEGKTEMKNERGVKNERLSIYLVYLQR